MKGKKIKKEEKDKRVEAEGGEERSGREKGKRRIGEGGTMTNRRQPQ